MEYKNTLGLSISEIEKTLDKGVQIVIIGSNLGTDTMALKLAEMIASERFACVSLSTLPLAEQENINKQLEPKDGSMDECVKELFDNINKTAHELKSIQEEEIFIEQKKPYQEFKRKNKKLKGWQKKR